MFLRERHPYFNVELRKTSTRFRNRSIVLRRSILLEALISRAGKDVLFVGADSSVPLEEAIALERRLSRKLPIGLHSLHLAHPRRPLQKICVARPTTAASTYQREQRR